MSQLLTFCFKGFLVLLPLALIGYIEYKFYTDYILIQLSSEAPHSGAYLNAVLNSVFLLMLLWSLL